MNQSRKPNSAIIRIVTTALDNANRENPTVPVPRGALAEVASELWRLRELALRESLGGTPRQRTEPQATQGARVADDGLWDANEVAGYLGASRSWVYAQAEAGRLPCVRIVGLLRFEPSTIRALARGEQPAATRVVAVPVRRTR
jgi:predicted DNA-binding transcriptional regulator AlpA